MKPIDDLLPAAASLIFVLESPYKDELIHGHPLAGSSGKAMTRHLRERVPRNSPVCHYEAPLGCEVINVGTRSPIGIMNASLWPLDRHGYPCTVRQGRQRVIEALELIRRNPGSFSRQNRAARRVEYCLLQGFRKRVSTAVHEKGSRIFVPCGELAEKFLNECQDLELQLGPTLPHPSMSGWSGLDVAEFDELLRHL